jgi:hypothetical protein
MIKEIIARLKSKATRIVRAVLAKLGAAIREVTTLQSAAAGFSRLIVQRGTANAMHAGKRYRLTSGHAPIFSLFTFFGLRQ